MTNINNNKIESFIIYKIDDNKLKDFVHNLNEERLNNSFFVYNFQVNDFIIKKLIKEGELQLVQLVQERYIDKKDFRFIKQNIWIKYQDFKLNIKEITSPKEDVYNCFLICNTIKESAEKLIKEKFKLNEKSNNDEDENESIFEYTSLIITRYHYQVKQKVELYIDCIYYQEISKFCLYGHIRCESKNLNELLLFLSIYDDPPPIKTKIIHYLTEVLKDNQLSQEIKLSLPLINYQQSHLLKSSKLFNHDPFYSFYKKQKRKQFFNNICDLQ